MVAARAQLESSYCADNGRLAIEPVLMLGTSLLQFLEGTPDRAAVEMLRYHAGWNFALNRQLGDELFHPTSLVNFRQRLIEEGLEPLGFQSILDGLVEAGLVARQSRQRLDSTQIFGRISRMSRLECGRETLRLALEELETTRADLARPDFWPALWERYVERWRWRVELAGPDFLFQKRGGLVSRTLCQEDSPIAVTKSSVANSMISGCAIRFRRLLKNLKRFGRIDCSKLTPLLRHLREHHGDLLAEFEGIAVAEGV